MLTILFCLALGTLLGFWLSHKQSAITLADKAAGWAVYLLLFLLGVSVGTNEAVMSALGALGWQAFWLSSGGVMGSVLLSMLVHGWFFEK